MVSRLIEVRQVGKRVLTLVLSEPLEIGRECDGVLLGDVKASRRHALLTPEDGGVTVEDLGSSNGTFVNGERITAPVLASPGDVIQLADTVVAVMDSDVAPVIVAATLVSEIDGSSALIAHLGGQKWSELLADHDSIVRDCLTANSGIEVHSADGSFTATFADALAGLDAAVAIERAIAARARETGWPIRVRVGVDAGDAGVAPALAARAVGGQILVSGPLHDLVVEATDIRLSPGREMELDGAAGAQQVHAVDWQSPG